MGKVFALPGGMTFFKIMFSSLRDVSGRLVNITEYQDQLVEAEARAFAEQFKGRLGG